jgi:hypothetical protein
LAAAIAAGAVIAMSVGGCGNDNPTVGTPESTTTTAAPTKPFDASAILTARGLGALELGMTVDEARAATGEQLAYEPPKDGGVQCGVLDIPFANAKTILVKTAGSSVERIVEIPVKNPEVRTDTGAYVGTTAAAVRAAYPEARQQNSHYSESLVVDAGQDALVFRFETAMGSKIADDAHVVEMSATQADAVRSEELCS